MHPLIEQLREELTVRPDNTVIEQHLTQQITEMDNRITATTQQRESFIQALEGLRAENEQVTG